jgi:hypothetical protein
MKKIIRIMGLCALVALALGSCKKKESSSFTATSIQLESDSKTHLDGYNLIWNSGDQITVCNRQGEARVFTVASVTPSGRTATFHVYDPDGDFMANLSTDNSYTAYYPNAVVTGNEVRLPIPARQYYPSHQDYTASGNILTNTFPMYGVNTNGNFQFGSETEVIPGVTVSLIGTDAGLLVIPINRKAGATAEEATIDSIVITSRDANDKLAGYMAYPSNGSAGYEFVGNSLSVTMIDPNPLPLPETGENRDYTFVLPKGKLASGFVMRGYRGGNKIFEREAAATGGEFDCTIVAGAIRRMVGSTIPPQP